MIKYLNNKIKFVLIFVFCLSLIPQVYGSELNLHSASLKGDIETVKLLIESGTDVNARNKDGQSPLHWAAFRGHYKIAELLIEAGANVNAACIKKWSPLHWAAKEGHIKLAELLIKSGADINATTKSGDTPTWVALINGNFKIAILLSNLGGINIELIGLLYVFYIEDYIKNHTDYDSLFNEGFKEWKNNEEFIYLILFYSMINLHFILEEPLAE